MSRMLTWRYHLLSLVGISLSDNGLVDTSQDVLVEDIQHNIDDLQNQNNLLGRDRAINQRFQDDTFPFIVGGRLQGKRIAIVASSTAGDELQRKLTSAVHGAGGQVVSNTCLLYTSDAADDLLCV